VYVFVALGIQHAMRLSRIVFRGLTIMQYFSTFSHKGHDFRKLFAEHEMCNFDFLYKF